MQIAGMLSDIPGYLAAIIALPIVGIFWRLLTASKRNDIIDCGPKAQVFRLSAFWRVSFHLAGVAIAASPLSMPSGASSSDDELSLVFSALFIGAGCMFIAECIHRVNQIEVAETFIRCKKWRGSDVVQIRDIAEVWTAGLGLTIRTNSGRVWQYFIGFERLGLMIALIEQRRRMLNEQLPNKPPEPTPTAVTPRATEGK